MGTRSLKASQKGIDRALIALAEYSLSQNALAEELGLSRQPVNNFFKGKPIDRENFALICDRLGLDLESTVAIAEAWTETNKDLDTSELDELVREVREKVRADIQRRCGEMRVLDMTRPIDLGTIYTDVNILQDISRLRRLDLAELLKNCSVEEFDRLGFAHVTRERRSGLEVVEEFDKLMLLGKPGAGKTTFLKRLATLCNAGEFQPHRVPIFISLKEFSDSSEKPELLPSIDRWFRHLEIRQPDVAEQILKRGRCFLLLDGLDEVSESNGEWILGEIRNFSGDFPDNAFVVSCRIAAKEFTFQSFTEVEVADFTDEQIEDFATRWFNAKQLSDKPREFLEQLKNYPRIKELATNPLLLTLLCLIFEDRTDFPANRSELYKEGLDVLLKKWDGKRGIKRGEVYRELSLKRKEDMLSQLAFTTFESGNYFFKQKEAENLIESYIQNLPGARTDPEAIRLDSEAVLKSIEAQHGLLVERARGIYSFSHLTFHEYFTARRIEKCEDLYPILISHLTEKRWREVILLTAGMLEKADSLLLRMKSQIDGMLANDEKLQQYLDWVNEKARSVDAPYKPAALRAFYFSLSRSRALSFSLSVSFSFPLNPSGSVQPIGILILILIFLDLVQSGLYRLAPLLFEDYHLDLDLSRTLSQSLSLDLSRTLSLSLSLDRALSRTLSLDRALTLSLDRTLSLSLDRALSLDFSLDFSRTLSLDLSLYLHLHLDFYLSLYLDLDPDPCLSLSLDRPLDRSLDLELERPLQELRDMLPDPHKDREHFKQWWQSNGSTWTEKLRVVMIEYRDIGHDWQFNEAQDELLRQYYYANQLLVDCLKSDCYISRSVREEIEASLLLPMSEIQKQFPNQGNFPSSSPE